MQQHLNEFHNNCTSSAAGSHNTTKISGRKLWNKQHSLGMPTLRAGLFQICLHKNSFLSFAVKLCMAGCTGNVWALCNGCSTSFVNFYEMALQLVKGRHDWQASFQSISGQISDISGQISAWSGLRPAAVWSRHIGSCRENRTGWVPCSDKAIFLKVFFFFKKDGSADQTRIR